MTFTGQVQVDFAHDPTSASYTWTDLTSRAQSAQYKRGRSYELGQIQAGTGSLALKNTDGAFDPSNGSSPYSPNVLPFKRIQHNVTVGGTTYPLFTGLVERWPQEWNLQYGTSPVAVVDMFAWLESITLRSCYEQEVLADSPIAFYPLTEVAGATSAGDISGNANPSLVAAAAGTGDVTFGGATGIPTDGTATLALNKTLSSSSSDDFNGYYLATPSALTASSTDATLDAWVSLDPNLATDLSRNTGNVVYVAQALQPGVSSHINLVLGYNAGGVYLYDTFGGTTVGPNLNDGGVHHIAVVNNKTANTHQLYVDGVQVVSAAGSLTPASNPRVHVGGYDPSGEGFVPTNQVKFRGGVGYVALYNTALPSARVTSHYTAGTAAFAGETADARISRLLGYGGWTATPALDTCTTTMLGATDIKGKSALTAIRDVATSEGGTFYVAKDGTATYTSRRTRMQTTTSAVTFGDGTSETPYIDISFDFDPTYVYNDIQITRTGESPVAAADATSRSHYGQRSYTAAFGIQSDSETIDAANWLLNNYLAPHTRIRSITVDALATTGAWAALLPLEIGSRVTVKRRPFGGVTITASSFVESIAWNITPTTARCTLELSPVPLQALIADDTTYGICDSTFVAAW